MTLLLAALATLLLGGALALVAGRRAPLATQCGMASAVAGSALGALPALRVLLGGPPASLRVPWDVPFGAFFIEIDPLSALFLVVILAVSAVAAVFGGRYLIRDHEAGKEGQGPGLGPPWFFYNLLVASMALVVVARNGMLFLVAWETMALASFFLVTFHDDEESVRQAGRTYLVATHLGTALLAAAFALLGREAGSLDFDRFAAIGPLAPSVASALFLLAFVGFGSKAGLVPFHVWLPEAHPAAPSHVSAVMSGAMINVGIYGLLRFLSFLGAPRLWWGEFLVGVGLLSGLLGALLALAQHDLKRLLAYSTVENVGVITLGIGVGIIGVAAGAPAVAALGLAGALLHVVNHALFKGLLFLGAGAVALETGTRTMDRLGGLLKRMPVTGAAFLVGIAGACALPPFSGFASEFLIFLAALSGGTTLGTAASLPAFLAGAGLALVGGLAAAAGVRAFATTFLGEPRTESAERARDPAGGMTLAIGTLAVGSIVAGLAAPWLVMGMARALSAAIPLPAASVAAGVAGAAGSLLSVLVVASVLLVVLAILAFLRSALLANRSVGRAGTWDCGYAVPTPRMQYTGSSFVQPLAGLFRSVLRTRREVSTPKGLFPREASLSTRTPDVLGDGLYLPAFRGIARCLAALRWLQHGRLNLYMLYVALTLLVLLVWRLG